MATCQPYPRFKSKDSLAAQKNLLAPSFLVGLLGTSSNLEAFDIAIIMVGEKASDMIVEDVSRG